MTNSKLPNDESMTNVIMTKSASLLAHVHIAAFILPDCSAVVSSFGHSTLIRHSDFVIRHLAVVNFLDCGLAPLCSPCLRVDISLQHQDPLSPKFIRNRSTTRGLFRTCTKIAPIYSPNNPTKNNWTEPRKNRPTTRGATPSGKVFQ